MRVYSKEEIIKILNEHDAIKAKSCLTPSDFKDKQARLAIICDMLAEITLQQLHEITLKS